MGRADQRLIFTIFEELNSLRGSDVSDWLPRDNCDSHIKTSICELILVH